MCNIKIKRHKLVSPKTFYKVVTKGDDGEYRFMYNFDCLGKNINKVDAFMNQELFLCVLPTEHGYSAFSSLEGARRLAKRKISFYWPLSYAKPLVIIEIIAPKGAVYWDCEVPTENDASEIRGIVTIMSPCLIGKERSL